MITQNPVTQDIQINMRICLPILPSSIMKISKSVHFTMELTDLIEDSTATKVNEVLDVECSTNCKYYICLLRLTIHF